MKLSATILSTLAIAVVISISSCTKSYTCHCDIVYSGSPGLPDTSVQEYFIHDTKTGAKAKCDAESEKHSNNGISSVETCYLY